MVIVFELSVKFVPKRVHLYELEIEKIDISPLQGYVTVLPPRWAAPIANL